MNTYRSTAVSLRLSRKWLHLSSVAVKQSSRKGKTPSSTRWLQRQNKDPLVIQATLEQYRSRSAFKLIELNDKFHFLKRGSVVIDCGARPGSWSQVAAKKIGSERLSEEQLGTFKHGSVIAVDIEAMSGLPGVIIMDHSDITDSDVHRKIESLLDGRRVDVIMSDMAPNATGMHEMDHHRIMELCQSAYSLAQNVLKTGGVFLCKIWQGSLTNVFKCELKEKFELVKECRLKATRKESSEVYLYAEGYHQRSPQD